MPRRLLILSVLGLIAAALAPANAALSPAGGPKCASARPPAGSKPARDDGVIRVANLNVLHGLTDEPPGYPASRTLNIRTSMQAAQIARAGVDIVGMEEVSAPGGPPTPAETTAALPDARACVETVGFEARAALWARMRTPAGLIDLTTTHLAHGITAGSDASSLQQAAVALAFSDARSQIAG